MLAKPPRIAAVCLAFVSLMTLVQAQYPYMDKTSAPPNARIRVSPYGAGTAYPTKDNRFVYQLDWWGATPAPAGLPRTWDQGGTGYGGNMNLNPAPTASAYDMQLKMGELVGNLPKQVDRVFAAVGGSVNLATGAEEFSRSLLKVQGAREIDFIFRYSSYSARFLPTILSRPLGWGTSFDCFATIQSTGFAAITFGGGGLIRFQKIAGVWTCVTPGILQVRFDQRLDGTMRLDYGDGRAIEFDASGKMLSDEDASGNTRSFTYSNMFLTRVTDDATGKYISFTYDIYSRLIGAADNMGRSVSFSHSPGFRITDARGKNTDYTSDSLGQITQVKDRANNIITTNVYNASGAITKQTDARGNYFTVAYSALPSSGLQAIVTDRMGNDSTYEFNADRLLTSYTDPLNNVTTWQLDASSQITQVTLPSGRLQTSTYSADGDITSAAISTFSSAATYFVNSGVQTGLPSTITAPGGSVTTITRDANNRPTGIANPDGSTLAYSYNAAGQPTSITGSDGSALTYTYASSMPDTLSSGTTSISLAYDAAGRNTSVTYPGSMTYSGTLDQNNALLSVVGPTGQTISTTYDDRGRPITTTMPGGASLTYGYDANHNIVSITDALSRVTTAVYDAEDRLTSVTLPGSRTVTYARDNAGRVTSVTSAAGRVTAFTYDDDGNLLTTTSPGGLVNTSTYNAAGLVATLIDSASQTTTLGYNAAGEVSSITSPESRLSQFGYDAVGRLVSSGLPSGKTATATYNGVARTLVVTDPGGKATTSSFSPEGWLSSVLSNGGQLTQNTYFPDGLLQSVQPPNGGSFTFAYDAVRALSSITTPDGTTSITRDAAGRVTSTTDGAATVSRTYDVLGRLTSYTSASGGVVGYSYNAAGDLDTVIYPDLTTVSYFYDADGLLIKTTDWAARDTLIARDSAGRISSVTLPNGASNEYTYGSTGAIASIVSKAAGGAIISTRILTRSHDGFVTADSGASLAVMPAPATLTFDADNRVSTFNATALTFDDNGNMLSGPTGTSPPYSIGALTYDSRNRLLTAGGLTSGYDPEGRRTTIVSGSGTTTLLYDPSRPLDQVLVKTAPGGAVTKYVYGAGLLYEDTAGTITGYHYDSHGSTVALTGSSGTLTDTFSYSAYGELVARTGSSSTPFLFNGAYGVQTDDNGLISMRARFYSPALKRFINQDVLVGSLDSPLTLNRYSFANGNPISLSDPYGFMATDFLAWSDDVNLATRAGGLGQGCLGLVQAGGAYTLAGVTSPTVAGGVFFAVVGTLGVDQSQAGFRTMLSGEYTPTVLNNTLRSAGASETQSLVFEVLINAGSSGGAVLTSRAPAVVQIAKTLPEGPLLSPSAINFSQRSVSSNVARYADDMANGAWDWSKSKPLRVMERDGGWVSFDNRRLMAAQQAGLDSVPVEIVGGAKWEKAFQMRFADPRNVSAGGVVPTGGLSSQPIVLFPRTP